MRHAVYVQVGEEFGGWGGSPSGQNKMWTVIKAIASTSKKMHQIKITDESEVFDAFKVVYGTKKTVTG